MKKFLFILFAFCYTIVANAQGTDQLSAVLQHGDEVTVYEGATAFQQAYAAAADGDVIVLSPGTFQKVDLIEKSLTILGAGFEDNAEANTAVTAFSSFVSIGKADAVIDGIRIEGVKIMGHLYLDYELKNFNVRKCHIAGEVYFNKNIETVTFKQCRIDGSVLGRSGNIVAKGLFLSNCYVNGNARSFSYESVLQIDHCYVAQYGKNDQAQVLITNSIIGGSSFSSASGIAPYSTLRNCIIFSGAGNFPSTATVETYYKVDLATIFADAENADYSETRTFELKDPNTYQGTDGTPIGPAGGEGWNKVPAKPSIANFNTSVSGTYLNVTYDADVK